MAPMNNRLLVPRKVPGLLDLVPGAAAAYSLRSLSNSYADPVVTVRRSSDDAEEDFTAAEVADGTLAAFCGAGDGFVYRWWDQSGNANHAVAAADANEPQIVDSGVVITDEGFPAIRFDETPKYLNGGGVGLGDVFSVFLIYRTLSSSTSLDSLVNTYATFQSGLGAKGLQMSESQSAFFVSSGTSTTLIRTDIDPYGFENKTSLLSYVCDGPSGTTGVRLRRNGASAGANTVTGGSTLNNIPHGDLTIGQAEIYVPGNPERALDGYMKEVIVYPSDLTAQVALIEGNMAWAWS